MAHSVIDPSKAPTGIAGLDEIVDLLQASERELEELVLSTPMLVRRGPGVKRMVVGCPNQRRALSLRLGAEVEQ